MDVIFKKTNLPKLHGSEKQVEWAERLRGSVYRNLKNQYDAAVRFDQKNPNESVSKYGFPGEWWNPRYTKEEIADIIKCAEKMLDDGFEKITSASAIIDNRGYLTDLWINALKITAKEHDRITKEAE